MMLRAGEAIPKGVPIYVDAAGTLKAMDLRAMPPFDGYSYKEAVEALLNPFGLGDPKDLADIKHRGAKRCTEIRLRGEQRRAWIEAEGRRRREEIGHVPVECVPLGRSEAERALRFKQMVEEHMVDAFVYTFRSLRVPKELLR